MEAEKVYQKKVARTIQYKRGGEGVLSFATNKIKKTCIQRHTKIVNSVRAPFINDLVIPNHSEFVGTRVDVILDPKDPQKGSEPGSDLSYIMNAINGYWQENWIKGHLINHRLSGPGVYWNLYPISRSANATHCNYVENVVINSLGEIKKSNFINNTNYCIYYSVIVTDAEHKVSNPCSKFTCEAYLIDGDQTNSSMIGRILNYGIEVKSDFHTKNKPQAVMPRLYPWGNPFSGASINPVHRNHTGWSYSSRGTNNYRNII